MIEPNTVQLWKDLAIFFVSVSTLIITASLIGAMLIDKNKKSK